ncbi:hypothetical protein CYMTET_20942 [Cymbomonas tetramitiformis]|uniref:Uncharacterized protein n=1 Tax=Cymbomonas tetramitiformis TaxID=36881 RepID=A0AAE0G323_9CHLO|nr:hypothetical protein CYMTET_20942 [Cymbomonas tetramitiformis]
MRGLGTKAEKLERLILLLQADDAASPSSECDSEPNSESDRDELEVDLATRSQARQAAARKRRENKQQNPVLAPSSTSIEDEHASDDTDDTDLDESLSDRRMRLAKEDLPADYTFEDMTVGSYAVTVAGGDETDKCWFDVMLPGGLDVSEIFTCWDENAHAMVLGGVPAGVERVELLNALNHREV